MTGPAIRDIATDIAVLHAKNFQPSYYSEPFVPHEWVIAAIVDALQFGQVHVPQPLPEPQPASENHFAKLFSRDGQQVLVTKDWDDKQGPMLRLRFASNKSGHKVELSVSFKGNKHERRQAREEAFANLTEETAFALRGDTPGIEI